MSVVLLGAWSTYAAYHGNLESLVKGWRYVAVTTTGGILNLVGWLLGIASKNRGDRLSDENERLRERLSRVSLIEKNTEAIFGVWLNYILKKAELGNESRASFYVLDSRSPTDRNFVYVARESLDPILRRPGRDRFPGDQGVIGAAWKSSEGAASYFASRNVRSDNDVIEDMIEKCQLSHDVASQLTMKSRVIIGRVLRGQDGNVGIVVIESLHSLKSERARKQKEKTCAAIVDEVTPHVARLFELYLNALLKQEEQEVKA